MTRQRLARILTSGSVGVIACASNRRSETLAAVTDMAERRGLAMIGAWQTGGPGSYLVPEAFSVTGAEVGKLLLPEIPYWLSVAPDGGWAAWVPRNSVFSGTKEPLVRFTNDSRSVRTLRFKGISGSKVAISSNAVHLALVAVVDPEGGRRLIVLDSATAEVEHDVTDLITRFRLADVYRFQISANGGRLAVASRESFVVIDLPSRKIMLDVDGRWPSLSPQGDILAFTDKSGYLIMASLATGARRAIRNRWWNIVGIGAWSPDGRFLLAGARDPIGLFTNLLAIDCAKDEFADLMRLDTEGDQGETCVWISRRLLSPAKPDDRP